MNKKSVQFFKNQKFNILKIIVLTVILSIVINIVSDGLCSVLQCNEWFYIILGVAVIILILLFVCFYTTINMRSSVLFKGAFIIDKTKENKLYKIPKYSISEDMCRYLFAASKENPAIARSWASVSFDPKDVAGHEVDSVKSREIIQELIEYCILNKLSNFIADYFNQNNKVNKTKKIIREDIPEVLLSNRFLRLFSEQIDNRMAFDENPVRIIAQDEEGNEEIVYMTGKNGEIYNSFCLHMPKGTKIYKKGDAIVIDTKLFVIHLHCQFHGYATNFNRAFLQYYVGADGNPFHNCVYQFEVDLNISYKPFSIFRFSDWKDYDWLDEFLNVLQNYCEKKAFLKQIDWDKQHAFLCTFNNLVLSRRNNDQQS